MYVMMPKFWRSNTVRQSWHDVTLSLYALFSRHVMITKVNACMNINSHCDISRSPNDDWVWDELESVWVEWPTVQFWVSQSRVLLSCQNGGSLFDLGPEGSTDCPARPSAPSSQVDGVKVSHLDTQTLTQVTNKDFLFQFVYHSLQRQVFRQASFYLDRFTG